MLLEAFFRCKMVLYLLVPRVCPLQHLTFTLTLLLRAVVKRLSIHLNGIENIS